MLKVFGLVSYFLITIKKSAEFIFQKWITPIDFISFKAYIFFPTFALCITKFWSCFFRILREYFYRNQSRQKLSDQVFIDTNCLVIHLILIRKLEVIVDLHLIFDYIYLVWGSAFKNWNFFLYTVCTWKKFTLSNVKRSLCSINLDAQLRTQLEKIDPFRFTKSLKHAFFSSIIDAVKSARQSNDDTIETYQVYNYST